MGRDLISERIERIFQRASEVLGYDLQRLCFQGRLEEGQPEVLNHTEFSQPAIVAASFAKFLENGETLHLVAGHGLGEYSAVCVAGCIEFEETIALVQERGKLIASSDDGRGAMAALLGLNRQEVIELAEELGILWQLLIREIRL